MYLLSSKEMQTMDHKTITDFHIPGRVLMESAGRGATEIFLKQFSPKTDQKVAVIAGRGNNGGDGFVMARYLVQKGISATIFLLSKKERVTGDAKENLDLADALKIPVIEIEDETQFKRQWPKIQNHDFFIDAILGTGLHSAVRGFFKMVIEHLNTLKKPIFAVDIPSGINSDNGNILGVCIKADATGTFAYPKLGHILHPGATCVGNLKIVDIGIPKVMETLVTCQHRLITPAYVRQHLPRRAIDAHKGTFGHLLIVAGSQGKTGAAAMTATSALRTGAGLVTAALPHNLNAIMETQVTEAMTAPLPENAMGALDEKAAEVITTLSKDKKVLALGPGMGVAASTQKVILSVMETVPLPMVIDADGLNNLIDHTDQLKNRTQETVLTPHPGEMARLTGKTTAAIQSNRIGCARDFATSYKVHLVLKGAKTIIAHPDGDVFINPTGNPGMASAGMGDVLTGMIAAFIAQGLKPKTAAHLGVYIHGKAADALSQKKGPWGYLATEVAAIIPEQIADLFSRRRSIPSLIETLN